MPVAKQKAEELTALRGEHKKVLTIVLVINAVLFFVEAAAGLLAHSTALLADSLDMFGDSLVYGFQPLCPLAERGVESPSCRF